MKKYLLLLLICSPVNAEVVNFTYDRATTWDDQSSLALSDIRSTRLYCNFIRVDGHSGAKGTFAADLADGTYTCVAIHTVTLAAFLVKNPTYTSCTAVDPDRSDICASGPSNEVTRIVGTPVEIEVGSPTNLQAEDNGL